MRKISFAAAVMALVATAPGATAENMQQMKASQDGLVTFVMPSGNIGCTYVPKGGTLVYEPMDGGPELICERVEPRYVTVRIGPKGPPQRIDNPGEQSCCSLDQQLAYGRSWSAGPFTCLSEKSGLTCNAADGHGVSMSRAAVKVW
jgi:hypothetical protein